ncbi:flagellar basal-body MS-ring/collar protein FliF [Brevundimonas sp. 2R-24]|uniref:Flagellar M-ring protein n=1 Tax=Peiella sedimenti TaxID=3061083 RepID=A0ABT8SHZ3_9CAUL|nr:flagellar basal-body MS-ring/collar protein FliF [Caulobacteraceae bacterium XZ-24]
MGSFGAALQRFGIGRLAALAGVAAGVAAVLAAVMLRMGEEPNALLYANLDLREAADITAALDQGGVKYESRGDGSTIFVPRDQVGTARLMLASRGLVTSGSVGYEIFDNQSVLGQTEFQQNLNEKRALEGELARTILSMRGITSARVHLALPQRRAFQQEAGEPTASVVVGTGGRDLGADQVRALRNLIASAVPNLRPDKVTVVDENNRTLAAGSEDDSFGAAMAADRKAEIEAQLTQRVQSIVEGVVGAGNARVTVTADIDMSRSTRQEQRFDPDGQVVRSTSTSESTSEDSESGTQGAATATANIPGGTQEQAGFLGPSSRSGDTNEITNYEISNTTTTTVTEPGQVRKLAVAVAVDGVTAPGQNGQPGQYQPRSEEDMQRIRELVQAAVGIDAERGDQLQVLNVRFDRQTDAVGGTEATSSMFDFDKNDIMRGVEMLVLAIVGLLMLFFFLRPMLKAVTTPGSGAPMLTAEGLALPAAGGGAVQALPGATQPGQLALPPSEVEQRLDIARIEGQVKASSVRKVADFVESHPEESVSILRGWVHES